MAKNNRNLSSGGFTLIELMVYVAIISVFLIAVTDFAINIISARTKSQSVQEVQQNARLAISRISGAIRESSGINEEDSVFGGNPGKISLVMDNDSGNNPMVFDIDGGRLMISKGGGEYQYVTGERVRITQLIFDSLGSEDTPPAIRISLSAEFANPGQRKDLDASISLETAVTARTGGE